MISSPRVPSKASFLDGFVVSTGIRPSRASTPGTGVDREVELRRPWRLSASSPEVGARRGPSRRQRRGRCDPRPRGSTCLLSRAAKRPNSCDCTPAIMGVSRPAASRSADGLSGPPGRSRPQRLRCLNARRSSRSSWEARYRRRRKGRFSTKWHRARWSRPATVLEPSLRPGGRGGAPASFRLPSHADGPRLVTRPH